MEVKVTHALPPSEAKRRLDKFGDNLKRQFPDDAGHITQTWNGDTCTISGKVKGFPIGCDLHVGAQDVTAKGDIPFFAKPFQGMIEGAIRNGIEKALTEAT